MFAAISPRYDLANQILSFGVHRRWRRTLVRRANLPPGSSVLDCATGTGDLALEWARALGPSSRIVGTDFCAPMLAEAVRKATALGISAEFLEADALALPFDDGHFDAASIAFGIRNVDDPLACLRELGRVVRPGGQVLVLEFGQPDGAFGAVYRFYARAVLPAVGGLITGQRAAYEYLPRTARLFPSGERFSNLMIESGAFSEHTATRLSGGIAFLYRGQVAASPETSRG
jgi:demethylmenaquinone methyltransferase/2-methoxy-6-polyprenyl-1,4-benzoquinol methylase